MDKKESYARYLDILSLREQRVTYSAIARKYGVSRERIRQIERDGVKSDHYKYQGTEPERIALAARNYYQKRRLFILSSLGGKCAKCGFSDSRALQIDHINGGGVKESRSLGQHNMYKKIEKEILSGTAYKHYQILCANCNWIKRYENGELLRKY